MSKKLATKQKLKHKINVGGVLVSIKNFEDAMMVELHEDSTFVQDVDPFVGVWDWTKALWRGDEMEGKRKWAKFGDG